MKCERLSMKHSRLAGVIACTLLLTQGSWAGPNYTVLHAFGKGTDGAGLCGGVTFGAADTLCGTTAGGGSGTGCDGGGCGTVFHMTHQRNGAWTETVLHSFDRNGHDGYAIYGGPLVVTSSHLYGTTYSGGTACPDNGCGTVFQLARGPEGWVESVLYSFGTQNGDGGDPTAGLIMDHSGNLYGTAQGGVYNGGVAFELSHGADGWNETVLYPFADKPNDGADPLAGLIFDPAGNLYGTTVGGGGYQCGSDTCGTTYELKRASGGWKEAILHRFGKTKYDGIWPYASLLRDAQGNLYGTTNNGGTHGGVVFELTPQAKGGWKETILYDFQGGADGLLPSAGVVMDKAGNLYGTTDAGGADDCGVIYKLAPAAKGQWTYTVLKTFYGADGCAPAGNLIMDKKGNLYGGTVLGGAYGGGVAFELTP